MIASTPSPRISQRKLASGAEAVVVALPHLHQTVVTAHLRVGPRYEQLQHNGISHFLEHMLYRGNASHPTARSLASAYESRGAELDAATYTDRGTMTMHVPPECVEELLPIFAETFLSPAFADLELEKGIVREEIREDLDDRGKQIDADTIVRRLAFGQHMLGAPITGGLKELERFDLDLLRSHHALHYTGGNTVLTIAGAGEPERLLDALEAAFADTPCGAPAPASAPEAPEAIAHHHADFDDSQTQVRLGFRAPGEHDPAEPAVDLLLRCLDDGMSTRLYGRICEELGLCYDVSADFEAYEGAGLVTIAAETAHAQAARVTDEIISLLVDLADRGPTDAELSKAKARHRWETRALMDQPEALGTFFGWGTLFGPAQTLAERVDELDEVSGADVQRVARQIFTPASASLATVGKVGRRGRKAMLGSVARLA